MKKYIKYLLIVLVVVLLFISFVIPKRIIPSSSEVKIISVINKNNEMIKYNEDDLAQFIKDLRYVTFVGGNGSIDMNEVDYEIRFQVNEKTYSLIIGDKTYAYETTDHLFIKKVTNYSNEKCPLK